MMKNALAYISLAIFMCMYSMPPAYAQDATNVRRMLYQDELHHFYVMKPGATVSINNNVTYYWYKNNAVHTTQGGFDGLLINGIYTVYYTDNDLKEKGSFNRGRKDGEWRRWHPNGRLMEISHWRRGLQNGPVKLFNDSGALLMEGTYTYGLRNGAFRYYENDTVHIEQYRKDKLKIPKLPRTKPADITPELPPQEKPAETEKEKPADTEKEKEADKKKKTEKAAGSNKKKKNKQAPETEGNN